MEVDLLWLDVLTIAIPYLWVELSFNSTEIGNEAEVYYKEKDRGQHICQK